MVNIVGHRITPRIRHRSRFHADLLGNHPAYLRINKNQLQLKCGVYNGDLVTVLELDSRYNVTRAQFWS